MFKILDQPLIFHVIEFLAKHEVHEIHLVLSHLPYQIENFCEEGKRWGVKIEHHLAQEPEHPYRAIKILSELWDGSPVLIGKGDTLPDFDLDALKEEYENQKVPCLLSFSDETWSGWAIGAPELFRESTGKTAEEDFLKTLKRAPHQIRLTKHFLEIRNLQTLFLTNLSILKDDKYHHLVPFTSKSVEKGLWVSRGVKIHRTAKIFPPAFIGEYSQIQENAKVGPNVVLEKNCVVENQTNVENSLILQQSYLGEGLNVNECIIDRHYLYNFKHKSRVIMNDDMIISELSSPPCPKKMVVNFFERAIALALLLLFSPLFLCLLPFRWFKNREVVHIPTGIDKNLWKTYQIYTLPSKKGSNDDGFIASLPMLYNVLKGDLHFVGTEPRTFREVYLMPPEWRSIYLKSKTGLLSIVAVDLGENPTSYQKFSAEAYYTSNMSLFLDISLFFRWIKKKLSRLLPS